MVFSSVVFLFLFLPAVIALYIICPAKLRNGLLFAVSLFFYAWGEPVYIWIMLFSTVFDYTNGLLLEYFLANKERFVNYQKYRKIVLTVSVVGNLGILCFFKYTEFLLTSLRDLTGTDIHIWKLALPIGISFYTFQTMSYTIDVYRQKVKAQHNLIAFGMYVSMFPQLIAGPIVRYASVEQQMNDRVLVPAKMAAGLQRFIIGLGKKVLLANQIGALWTEISTQKTGTVLGAWLGAIAFMFQIYFDFSGYSDMAIGLGHIFGFTFPENFKYPYISKSITEFWRRWHITLSTWFREYLYIPLGGNRRGRTRQIWNLFVVWSLTGLWHGASWNFVLWGIYYFILLTIEKIFLGKKLEQLPGWLQHGYTCLIVLFGWVIFANENIADLGRYFLTMFGANGALYNQTAIYQWYTHIPLLVVLIIGSTKLPKQLLRKGWTRLKLIDAISSHQEQIRFVAASIFTVLVLYCSVAFLVSGSYNPFLYFRF